MTSAHKELALEGYKKHYFINVFPIMWDWISYPTKTSQSLPPTQQIVKGEHQGYWISLSLQQQSDTDTNELWKPHLHLYSEEQHQEVKMECAYVVLVFTL
jgi:hypothetical protein